MVKDRLKELQEKSGLLEEEASREVRGTTSKQCFDQISQKLHSLTSQLDSIQNDIKVMRSLHSTILNSPTSEKTVDQRLKDVTESIETNLRKITQDLKSTDQKIKMCLQSKKLSPTEFRMIQTSQSSILNKFSGVKDQLYDAKDTFDSRCKSRVKRSLEIAGQSMTDEEIDQALQNGTPIFCKEFADSNAAKMALRDIQDRHQELLSLEKSLIEIHDMFIDLSNMISLQGEKIETIEQAVIGAGNDVEKGKEQLEQAVKSKSKWQKRKCCLITTVICIILLIVLITVITSLINKK